ncbi:uncharacterized protein PHACADRAFT_172745 [Phanerochaete carnosa HHB-10118-sp]|uniref:MYND-type domain-containing protein n=1 Tax=Phanerochaete carnosa (strain HHB-10118-sp) TaxID=650164 RepID=K5X2N0_PHACS|nr:uncharacterized protein PHACADRAFT_172745 [Phanerochaete carnosa HHB-10118-sp]EKM57062.1 hypothetical protein PHACADRAFT_172745 [Phanerochaete carnosa HHB-10118-sp]
MPPKLDHGRRVTRFVHYTTQDLVKDRVRRELGEKQHGVAEQWYHQLCAAVKGDYELTTVPPDLSRSQLFAHSGIVFDKYTAYKLEPVTGVKLHPREDGTILPGDLQFYSRTLRDDWQCREGGIMRCMAEEREFWNMILNYHSSAGTTGYKPWDRLFEKLKRNNFDRGMVPCMFFARETGCLYPRCLFLHDRVACEYDRERVLAKRRAQLGRPPPRDLALLEKRALKDYRSPKVEGAASANETPETDPSSALALLDDEEDMDPEVYEIFEESSKVRKICNNPECLRTRTRGKSSQDVKMLRCSRCTVANYCSAECQRADWKRHKEMPCKPFEVLLEDDDLWNPWGGLKGMERFPVHYG